MFITMAVSLYTSRAILQVLGVSDFGVYNVVGGMVSMFSFINSAMSGCTQRFLNVCMGRGDATYLKKVFSVALGIHFLMGLVFLLTILGIGYYLVSHTLNIEAARVDAAKYVLVFSILATVVNFVSMPFDAAIISHEKMDFYAYLSIFDVVVKLVIVFLLYAFPDNDSLILYSLFYMLTNVLLLCIYVSYACKNFEECTIKPLYDNRIVKEMGAFLSWNVLANLAFFLSTQGTNMIFNVFLGTVVNAAWGVSMQVSGVLNKFSNNIQIAATPQIMKLYSSNQVSEMFKLTKTISLYVVLLMAIFGIPLIIEIDYILSMWLTEVPQYSSYLVSIMIINNMILGSYFPLTRVLQATGKISLSCIFSVILHFFQIVFAFLILKLGGSLYIAALTIPIPSVFSYAILFYLVKKYTSAKISEYVKDVFLKYITIIGTACLIPLIIHSTQETSFIRLIIVISSAFVGLALGTFYIGIDGQTRIKIIEIVRSKFKYNIYG